MGLCASADVGFDWWRLLEQKKWDALILMVEARAETCVQPHPDTVPETGIEEGDAVTGDMLLHRLCAHPDAPTRLYRAVVDARPDVVMRPDAAGRLPLAIACRRGGPSPDVTTQLLLHLLEVGPDACKQPLAGERASGGRGGGGGDGNTNLHYLPLHELLAHGAGVDGG